MAKASKSIKAAVESAHRAVETVRARIADLKAERSLIASAPLPFEVAANELKAQITRIIAAYDGNTAINALPTIDRAVDYLATKIEIAPAMREPDGSNPLQNAIVYFFGDTIVAKLTAELRRRYSEMKAAGIEPMEPEARKAAVAKLDEQIAEVEAEEEALILDAEEAGVMIPRRADTDPRVFLEIEGA